MPRLFNPSDKPARAKWPVIADLLKEQLIPAWRDNFEYVDELDKWSRGEHPDPVVPKEKVTEEYRGLIERSTTPWCRLVVDSLVQGLYVEGFRRSSEAEAKAKEAGLRDPWRIWQANRFDAVQSSVYRGAIAHGHAYVSVLPGKRGDDPIPVMRPHSARRMLTFYEDLTDEWPIYALHGESVGGKNSKMRWKLYDAEAIWVFDGDLTGGKLDFLEVIEHNVGVCPVVRYAVMDIDGRSPSEIEPLIRIAKRIDQTNLDRLIVQRFGAWVVRWATGLELPTPREGETPEEAARREKIRLSIEDFLVSSGTDTKFGSLPASDLRPFLDASDSDIRALAAISQTPPHYLLGHMVQLSAEALASAEAGRTRRLALMKHAYGEANEQTFRLGAHLYGDEITANDWEGEVVWADLENQSLAATADALGKLVQSLEIPPQALWERVPGVTQGDVERWKQMAQEGDLFGDILERFNEDFTAGEPEAA